MGTHVIENDALKITVDDRGAELCSVIDKPDGLERIWTADPSIWNRHAPILFPFVGKVTDGKYRVDGKEFSMRTQHGFARDLDFTCTEDSGKSVTHSLESTAVTKEQYPYDFRLTVRHSLLSENPRQLYIGWTIENCGKEKMYYSIGGHPGFLMPPGVKKEDCWLAFPGRDELCCFGADAAGYALPDGKHFLHLDNGFVKYQKDIPDTWIFENQQIDRVELAGPDKEIMITMKCEQFPMLAVWANAKGPFICLEPWFGRTDDAGFRGSLDEKTGMEMLGSGEKKNISYSIEFHDVRKDRCD